MRAYEQQADIRTSYGHDTAVVEERRTWFSPGRVFSFLLGLVLTFMGAIALFKTGVDDTLNVPLVTVFGITHSAVIGLIEVVVGVLMIVASTAEDTRGFIGAFGVLALIAGIIGLASSAQLRSDIGFGTDTAWFFVVWGIIALVASLLPSVLRTRREVVDRNRVGYA